MLKRAAIAEGPRLAWLRDWSLGFLGGPGQQHGAGFRALVPDLRFSARRLFVFGGPESVGSWSQFGFPVQTKQRGPRKEEKRQTHLILGCSETKEATTKDWFVYLVLIVARSSGFLIIFPQTTAQPEVSLAEKLLGAP